MAKLAKHTITLDVDTSGIDAATAKLEALKALVDELAARGLPMTVIIPRLVDDEQDVG